MNYYQVLDVSPNATQSEIKNAYRNMIKAFHPDYYRGSNKEFAERKTKELNEAYEILSNPSLREQYDNWLKYQTFTSSEERNNKRRDDSSENKKPNENSSAKGNPNERTVHTNAKSSDSSKDVKKGKKYPIVALLIIIAVAVIGFVFSNQTPNSNQEKYDVAVEMMEEGNYKEAEKIFVSLGDFGDSKEQIINCRIMKADDLLKQENYREALGYYSKYSDNPNVSEGKINQCKEGIYQEGIEYYRNGEFDMAIFMLEMIGDYSDSLELIEKCKEILEVKNQ